MERETKAFEIMCCVDGDEKEYKSTDLEALISGKTGKTCPSHISSVSARHTYWNDLKGKPCA